MDNFHSNLGLSRDYLGITGNDPVSLEISFELLFALPFLNKSSSFFLFQ